jgi:hypothetical protein
MKKPKQDDSAIAEIVDRPFSSPMQKKLEYEYLRRLG